MTTFGQTRSEVVDQELPERDGDRGIRADPKTGSGLNGWSAAGWVGRIGDKLTSED